MKNKKMLLLGLLTACIMLSVSMVSATNIQKERTNKLESPIFKIRTLKATEEEVSIKYIIRNVFEQRFFLNQVFEKSKEREVGKMWTGSYVFKCAGEDPYEEKDLSIPTGSYVFKCTPSCSEVFNCR